MTHVLNLTPGFAPLTSHGRSRYRTPLELRDNTIWSGGEIKLSLKDSSRLSGLAVTITTRLNTGDDILRLIMAAASLREAGCEHIEAFIPYVPYARQDRVCNVGEPHALRAFAKLINAQGFKRVFVFDPHSHVTEALIDNCTVISNGTFVTSVIANHISLLQHDSVLVAPDAGAEKKLCAVADMLTRIKFVGRSNVKGALYASKNRAPDGTITGTTIHNATALSGKIAVIVDDICDGGRSFYPLARLLKEELDAAQVMLIVSHGIFSYSFLDNFLDNHIDAVFATDSIRHENHARTPSCFSTTIKLESFLNV